LGDHQQAGRWVGVEYANGLPQTKEFFGTDLAAVPTLMKIERHGEPSLTQHRRRLQPNRPQGLPENVGDIETALACVRHGPPLFV
jgi:hypothetical protein